MGVAQSFFRFNDTLDETHEDPVTGSMEIARMNTKFGPSFTISSFPAVFLSF
jgi:hypothetical protein